MRGLSLRTIYKRIEATRGQIGTYHSRRAAAAIFASNLGIDVHRILRNYPEQIEELQKVGLSTPVIIESTRKIEKGSKPLTIEFDKKIVQTFGLPSNLEKQASMMSSIYPHFYAFENLLRHVIMSTLERKYGNNWWDMANISREIKDQVEKRRKEEGKNRWVGRRGAHSIFYTDFGDLGRIINTNYQDFKDIFPDLTWITSRINDIEESRNIIAHNNPLPEKEITRIKIYWKDLSDQLIQII